MRQISDREFAHERMAVSFEAAVSDYDTRRRVDTLIDEFIGPERLSGRNALDVGCGLGYFSERLRDLGATVTACDIGAELVRRTKERVGCRAIIADAVNLTETFGPASFDIVVSSECIEHTPRPLDAVRQMATVLRPGGYLALSTPNLMWWPVVKAATLTRLRPFDGLENFSTWRGLHSVFEEQNLAVIKSKGLHLFPFQFGLHRMSTWIDMNCQFLKPLMINICLLGQKRQDKS